MFYPWAMYLLTVKITKTVDLPKLSLFCEVQSDVESLPSYSKPNSKVRKSCGSMLASDWLLFVVCLFVC